MDIDMLDETHTKESDKQTSKQVVCEEERQQENGRDGTFGVVLVNSSTASMRMPSTPSLQELYSLLFWSYMYR
jgi:hypothetical protein